MSYLNLYNKNGVLFWSEEEIRIRNMFVNHMVSAVKNCLLSMNNSFKMIQCEAPIFTPASLINSNYNTHDDIYALNYSNSDHEYTPVDERIALRPETTMGSYAYARHILSGYNSPNYKLPICVWQHGKSFRKEQDQPSKFMRLKEFYQLEFQILFSKSTLKDYYPEIVDNVRKCFSELLDYFSSSKTFACFQVASDRLPSYSDETTDIMFGESQFNAMEICSISRRKDFDPNIKNIEIAIGTDRCVYNFLKKRE